MISLQFYADKVQTDVMRVEGHGNVVHLVLTAASEQNIRQYISSNERCFAFASFGAYFGGGHLSISRAI